MQEVAHCSAAKKTNGEGIEPTSRMGLLRPVKEHIAQLTSILLRQIPFENLHCHGGMMPSEPQICLEVGGIDYDNILFSHIPWIGNTIATPGIPKNYRSIWTNEPQSCVVGPQRCVHNNHLEPWLVRGIGNGLHIGWSTNPIFWQIRCWQVNTARHQTGEKKRDDNDRVGACNLLNNSDRFLMEENSDWSAPSPLWRDRRGHNMK